MGDSLSGRQVMTANQVAKRIYPILQRRSDVWDWLDEWQERAAIMEHHGGATREKADRWGLVCIKRQITKEGEI